MKKQNGPELNSCIAAHCSSRISIHSGMEHDLLPFEQLCGQDEKLLIVLFDFDVKGLKRRLFGTVRLGSIPARVQQHFKRTNAIHEQLMRTNSHLPMKQVG